MPYRSGTPTSGGITPYVFGGALGVAAFYPGLWLYSAYAYPYARPWYYYNTTRRANQTTPVQCLCEEYQECGCEENDDAVYQAALIGDGSYASLNKTVITVASLNGTDTILLNGTLPNGTTAAGGTEDPDGSGSMVRNSGLLMITAAVFCAVFLA